MNGETQYRAPRRFAKRRGGPEATEHEHPDPPETHQRKLEHTKSQADHTHARLIDDFHANWPH